MKITYFGHSYFLIEGNDYSIALDPFKNVGLEEKRCKADYLFCSHEHFDHNNRELVDYKEEIVSKGDKFDIINSFHDNKKGKLRGINRILKFKLDGHTLVFMGDYGESENFKVINKIQNVDIVFIPVGGTYTIDASEAAWYTTEIDAKVTIPIHYALANTTVDIDPIDEYMNLVGDYELVDSPLNIDDFSKKKVVIFKEEK